MMVLINGFDLLSNVDSINTESTLTFLCLLFQKIPSLVTSPEMGEHGSLAPRCGLMAVLDG